MLDGSLTRSARRILGCAFVAAGLAAAATTPAAAQSAKVQVGVLVCDVAPSIGFVLGSVRELSCTLQSRAAQPFSVLGSYKGTIARFGVDLGVTSSGQLGWAVFAPTTSVAAGDLSGTYVGASADAAIGIGGGANVLLGGSSHTIALQPLSVSGITGLSIAAGVADLTLTAIAPPAVRK